MDLIDTLRSTGAVREFLPEPVADDTIARILDSARFAPNGGNRQAWRVVVVKDPDIRRGISLAYAPGWNDYLALGAAGLVPFAPVTDESRAADAIAKAPAFPPGPFVEHLDEVPVMLALLADLRLLAALDKDSARYPLAGGASIYPFAWSILLAARAEGLGGVITTMAIPREESVLSLLGAPPELVLAAVIVLGRPAHVVTRLRRAPVSAFATIDRVDGEALTFGEP
jgi:nitroreductase